jgi:hypothetical protein
MIPEHWRAFPLTPRLLVGHQCDTAGESFMATSGAAARASLLAGTPGREVGKRTWDATAEFASSQHAPLAHRRG